LSLIKHFSHSCSYPDKFAKGIPVHIIKLIVRDVLKGLDFLHLNCRVIHTDLKPENVLLSHPMQESLDMIRKHEFVDEILPLVKIVDLGNACWTYKHFTDYITTRQYRSPEAIVEFEYSTAVDIWSLACITFELITGEYLFDPRADKNGAYSRDEDHLALMIELLGEAPDAISKLGRSSSKFFSKDGSLRNIHDLMHWPIDALLYEKHDVPKAIASEISSFLSPMLQMDPLKRATAAQCLEHEWLSDFQVSVALDEEKQKTNSGSKVLSGLARLQPSGFHSRSVPVPANNHKAGGNSSKYMKI
jgi:serine/threonine protein kinase